MATIKVVLRKKIRKDGTFPLALSIVKDRKPTYIHIGKNILETDWDAIRQKVKKSHLNATFLNNYIRMRLADATDRLLEMELRKEEFSAVNLKNQSDASTNLKFLNQSALYLSNLRDSGKFNRLSAEAPRINRFKEFLGGKDIPFQD
ncbi:MAG TPA: Arm DNA-binding domain-containing protein, partial [Chitinophagales bacterium]|nr:Arm DNA-binding domain-containing protein [Chitinophagales bacterium]